MSGIVGLIIVLGLLILLAKGLASLVSSQKGQKQNGVVYRGPTNEDRLPYTAQKYLFSIAERSFYEVLKRLLPEHTIFAKVRLADVIRVEKNTLGRQSPFNRISSKHIDFLVCDSNLAPVLAIELDDSSHDEEERKERDVFVDEVFGAAKFPLVHIRAKRGYVTEEVRNSIAPFLQAAGRDYSGTSASSKGTSISCNRRPPPNDPTPLLTG